MTARTTDSPGLDVLSRACELLTKIRLTNWPTPGLGLDLNPEEFDDVLMDEAPARASLKRESGKLVRESAKARTLAAAASRAYEAYLAFGPLSEHRPEGRALEQALTQLRDAVLAAGFRLTKAARETKVEENG